MKRPTFNRTNRKTAGLFRVRKREIIHLAKILFQNYDFFFPFPYCRVYRAAHDFITMPVLATYLRFSFFVRDMILKLNLPATKRILKRKTQ